MEPLLVLAPPAPRLQSAPDVKADFWGHSQVRVRCPFCRKYHYHGRAAGLRIAHCNSPGVRHYIIVLPGKEPL